MSKVTIDELAVMIKNGFDEVDKKFEEIKQEFKEVHQEITEVRSDIQHLSAEFHSHKTDTNETLVNHDKRLRTLETPLPKNKHS